MNTDGRLGELDSLRGIASMSVVLYHSASLLGIMAALPFLYQSPLQVLLAGHQAVIFFFLLSGFVLALPFTDGRTRSYGHFLLRRLCRLYPPYIVALMFGCAMRLLFYRVPVNDLWSRPITWVPILQHIVMIDQFHQQYFDPVIWSLVMEMRIALIFPFLIWFVMRVNWKWSFWLGLILSAFGIYFHVRYQNNIDFFTNYYDTAHYTFMFLMGAILAKHRARLIENFHYRHIVSKVFFAVIAFVLYTWGNNWGWNLWGLTGDLVSDWVTMVSACFFIVAALTSRGFKKVLLWRPVAFVGRVSYSLYLVHLVVLLVFMNVFTNPLSIQYPGAVSQYLISPYWLMLFTVVVSLTLAWLSYRFVERPSIALGRKITRSQTPRLSSPADVTAQP